MKVALVYDRVNKWGGAERVLLVLHKIFPDAPLYTSVYDPIKAPWAKVFNVKTSFLQNFPFAMRHELYAGLMPLAFESFSSQGGFDEYDLVISVTSEAAKGIITKPQTKHICYCLTPTRYLWSGYEEYFKNPLLKFLSKPVVSYLKFWDKIAAQRPDKFIAISKEVQGRIRKYYGRESAIVYPPADSIKYYVSSIKYEKNKDEIHNTNYILHNTADYFLIVSRLVPYKRIDLAIEAFDKLKLPLKIIGVGSEMEKLKKMAGPTIEFLGNLTDKTLIEYYKGCRALVFPGIEDFGLTVLEAQSFGKPIIAFRGGGVLETVIEGKTGLFFKEPNVESLIKAIKQFNNLPANALHRQVQAGLTINLEDCIKQAEKFNFETFKRNFIREILKQVQNDTLER